MEKGGIPGADSFKSRKPSRGAGVPINRLLSTPPREVSGRTPVNGLEVIRRLEQQQGAPRLPEGIDPRTLLDS